MMLGQSEMKIIHEIISTIYCSKDITAMRQSFMRSLSRLIDFDMAIFDLGKTAHGAPYTVDSIMDSKFSKMEEDQFLYRYETTYASLDYIKWVFSNSESMVYRTSDLINDDYRKKTAFYLEFLKSFRLDYAAGIVIISNLHFTAALTLFKMDTKGDFSEQDLLILEQFLPHLQSRFLAEDELVQAKGHNISYLLKHEYQLTNREVQIMGCIYRGMKNDEIAELLSIAPNTVKKHITNLYSKLELNGRVDLIKFIVANNLTDLCERL